jgi:hypothetical protein
MNVYLHALVSLPLGKETVIIMQCEARRNGCLANVQFDLVFERRDGTCMGEIFSVSSIAKYFTTLFQLKRLCRVKWVEYIIVSMQ